MVAHTSIMPGIMIERPKMTRVMYQSLKRHIMKEREKIRQGKNNLTLINSLLSEKHYCRQSKLNHLKP